MERKCSHPVWLSECPSAGVDGVGFSRSAASNGYENNDSGEDSSVSYVSVAESAENIEEAKELEWERPGRSGGLKKLLPGDVVPSLVDELEVAEPRGRVVVAEASSAGGIEFP
jgi:hypothetical protein